MAGMKLTTHRHSSRYTPGTATLFFKGEIVVAGGQNNTGPSIGAAVGIRR
jgi:hypothetical protein